MTDDRHDPLIRNRSPNGPARLRGSRHRRTAADRPRADEIRHRQQQSLRHPRSAPGVRHRAHRDPAEHVRRADALGRQSAQAGQLAGRQVRHLAGRKEIYVHPETEHQVPRRHGDDRGGRGLLDGAHPGAQARRLRPVQGRGRARQHQGDQSADRRVQSEGALRGVPGGAVRALGGQQQAGQSATRRAATGALRGCRATRPAAAATRCAASIPRSASRRSGSRGISRRSARTRSTTRNSASRWKPRRACSA